MAVVGLAIVTPTGALTFITFPLEQKGLVAEWNL